MGMEAAEEPQTRARAAENRNAHDRYSDRKNTDILIIRTRGCWNIAMMLLSTHTMAPTAFASATTAAMSVICRRGLVGLSMMTRRTSCVIAFLTSCENIREYQRISEDWKRIR